MLGMVLAAGAGRRLRPYTDTLPKALVPVDGDTTIMDISIRNLAAVGLREIVIIVGYQAQAVHERKDGFEKRYGVKLELVHNDKAEEWNNAYSLWCARDYFSQGALLVNGDTVHPVSVEETLLSAPETSDILLAVDNVKKLADEEMKVTLDGGDLKRITKLMDPDDAYGEYIGATLIRPGAAERLADALKTTFEGDPQLYYEDGYQVMVDRGEKIHVAPIGDVKWVEVDNHDDLAKARQIAGGYEAGA
ncbi:sugar phosphate nucleotidyltransferase [Nonomuraea sp. NPDC050663]|uniref:phosphocholine cytidylyltransferase family protein n=1 Tax=Nonomuraea sp. NPDC050663 TaxID=3364370 RepID=UPI0037938F52